MIIEEKQIIGHPEVVDFEGEALGDVDSEVEEGGDTVEDVTLGDQILTEEEVSIIFFSMVK